MLGGMPTTTKPSSTANGDSRTYQTATRLQEQFLQNGQTNFQTTIET
jgi:hypothetical protein